MNYENIIKKLPKTKDGVPVIPEIDFVWYPDDIWEGQSPEFSKRLVIKRKFKGKRSKKLGNFIGQPVHFSEYIQAGVHECYSSFDAALKANEDKND